jgi:hypothetical protein
VAKKMVVVWHRHTWNGPVMHRLREDGKTACGLDPGVDKFAGPGTVGLLSRKKAKQVKGIHKHQHRACYG